MISKKQIREAKSSFANDLHQQYIDATSTFLDRFKKYRKYQITITNTNRNQRIRPTYFFKDVSDVYREIQDRVFSKRHKGQIPEHFRPLLLFFLDLEGSKGNGRAARFELKEANGKAILNLHAHGILLLNPNTHEQFKPDLNIRIGNYFVHFQPFDEEKFSTSQGYISKMVAGAKLRHIEFCQGYLYHSKRRECITPKELEGFVVAPPAANTNSVQSTQLDVSPKKYGRSPFPHRSNRKK